MSDVWLVRATGGVGIDRICDSEETAKAVCADYLACLSSPRPIVEDWQDLSADRDGRLQVRYFREERWSHSGRRISETVEQRIERQAVDASGTWFRERISA